uniref:Orfan n=1 Tax=Strongyloides stercoralis TaxID=6248 RepID=A0A0K0ESC9_STRER
MNNIQLTINDIIDTFVGSFLVIIIIGVLILLSILIINILILLWYCLKFLVKFITTPCYKISRFSKSLNNPYLKEEYFKTISLENTKDKFKIGNIYDNLNKYNENIDNKSSTLFYQLNCKKDLPYEETTYITMPTNFVSQKYLHKENHAVEKRNSIQFTIYTV